MNEQIKPCWACQSIAKERHHLKPIRCNGSDHPENMIDLCVDCHDVVDNHVQPNKKSLERFIQFPRLQLLLMVRISWDLQNRRAEARIEQETLQWAIRVLENPNDTKPLPKLLGAVKELRTRYKTSVKQ